MPLLGLTDRQGRNITWAMIAKGMGDFEDPLPLLMALYSERDSYCDFSVTELNNDPYQVQMKRRYGYFEAPDDIGDRLLGIALHALMEKKADQIIKAGVVKMLSETRFCVQVKVGGKVYRIGGTCDLDLGHTIWDYKTLTISKLRYLHQGKAQSSLDAWEYQLNAYAWMKFKLSGVKTSALNIRCIVKDWRFSEFRQAEFSVEEYPRGLIVPIDVWPFKRTEKEILKRLLLHAKAERMSDARLHSVGECDTWTNQIRCDWYCPLKSRCHFRNKSKQQQQQRKR